MAAERKGGIRVGTIICAFAAYAAFKMYSNSWTWDDIHQWVYDASSGVLDWGFSAKRKQVIQLIRMRQPVADRQL